MHVVGIDEVEAGPPPLRRAVVGIVLGLVTGALAAALLPPERRRAEPVAVVSRRDGSVPPLR